MSLRATVFLKTQSNQHHQASKSHATKNVKYLFEDKFLHNAMNAKGKTKALPS